MNNVLNESVRNRVRNSVRKHKGHPNPRFDTSDIVQDVMIQLWRDIKRNGLDEFLVKDIELNRISHGHTTKQYRMHLALKRSFGREREFADEVSMPIADPAEIVQENEDKAAILDQFEKLDRVQKFILYQRFFNDASFAEIGVQLNRDHQWVRRQYIRSIKDIKQGL